MRDEKQRGSLSAEEMAKQICKIATNACNAAAPQVKGYSGDKTQTYWWSEEIAEARRDCIHAMRIWTRCKRRLHRARAANYDEEDIANVQQDMEKATKDFRKAKKALKKYINRAKYTAWKELIQSVEADPWGRPYKLVLNKLRRASPCLTKTLVERDL